MFLPQMWSDEVERIGLSRCTPTGSRLKAIGDLVGFVGLAGLAGVGCKLVHAGATGAFRPGLMSWLFIPVGLGVFGSILGSVGWALAGRKGFEYDHDQRVSRWVESGQIRTYTHADWLAEANQT